MENEDNDLNTEFESIEGNKQENLQQTMTFSKSAIDDLPSTAVQSIQIDNEGPNSVAEVPDELFVWKEFKTLAPKRIPIPLHSDDNPDQDDSIHYDSIPKKPIKIRPKLPGKMPLKKQTSDSKIVKKRPSHDQHHHRHHQQQQQQPQQIERKQSTTSATKRAKNSESKLRIVIRSLNKVSLEKIPSQQKLRPSSQLAIKQKLKRPVKK